MFFLFNWIMGLFDWVMELWYGKGYKKVKRQLERKEAKRKLYRKKR